MNINDFPSIDKKNDELILRIGEIADKYNFEVYAVGGYVRDRILGRERKEIDLLVVGDGTEFARIVKQRTKNRKHHYL